jgi:PLP dependent protein
VTISPSISESLLSLQKQIERACQQAHRSPDSVHLLAVSKKQTVNKITIAFQNGQKDFGENYVQELQHHQAAVPEARWHYIGQLQRNKVKHLIGTTCLIHSVDSLSLIQEINTRAQSQNIVQDILLQLKLVEENTKGGLGPNDLSTLWPTLNAASHIRLKGLMVLPPFHEDPEDTRKHFRHLREIRDEINNKTRYKELLLDLSMGMSHDFAIAIEEGATWIRIGTALFGDRENI